MRGQTTKILLLLTGLLMLSLSVLPHHHHGNATHFRSQEACANCLSCSDDDSSVTHSEYPSHPADSDCKHAHQTHATDCEHHSGTDQDCGIKQLFVTFAREDNTPNSCDCTFQDAHDHLHTLAIALIYSYAPDLLIREAVLLPEPPYIEHTYTVAVGKTLALRAPPVHIA